jgi:hypothetical protein
MAIVRIHQARVQEAGVGGNRIRIILVNVESWTVTLAMTLTVSEATFLALMLARVHQTRIHKTGIRGCGHGGALINNVREGLRSFTSGNTLHIIPR